MATSSESLCFVEAATAKQHGRINDDEYYHHLLAHLAGVTHENDIENANKDDYRLRLYDPFAYLVQRVSKEFRDATDAAPFESIFKAYRIGTYSDVIMQHDNLKAKEARHIRKLLALRALLDKRSDVLLFCLQIGGFEYDEKFKEEANKIRSQEHPETFGVLEASEVCQVNLQGRDHRSAVFDAGGALPVDW
ncbi:hypothetical protein FHL15_002785 [Xylaria flabelliformis]|uniref:Uncharacterized protein n=1 Tax=Xylaria flabelliformis TaxID=2512241 RepID=A0A553I8I4_9PEZI|nr:hypothetical protein FHL15_002785 [Xylaria flabelliformis]